MAIKQKIAALLLATSAYAAETVVHQELGWGVHELVMDDTCRTRAALAAGQILNTVNKINALNSVTTSPSQADTYCNEIRDWLNGLKVPGYQNTYIRRINGHVVNYNGQIRNKVDDALRAFDSINQGYSNFDKPIENNRYRMKDVLSWVWIIINNYAQINIGSDNSNEIQCMKDSLLTNLSEMIKEDGHLVSAVSQSQRIVLTLQGYITGINVTATVDLNAADNDGSAQAVTGIAGEFVTLCNTSLTAAVQALDQESLLSYIICGGNFRTATDRDLLLEEYARIQDSWVNQFRSLYPSATRTQLARLIHIFDMYKDVIRDTEIRADEIDCPSFNAAHYSRLRFNNGVDSAITPSRVQSNTNVIAVGSINDNLIQPVTTEFSILTFSQPEEQEYAVQPQTITEPTIGIIIEEENGRRYRWNGSFWYKL